MIGPWARVAPIRKLAVCLALGSIGISENAASQVVAAFNFARLGIDMAEPYCLAMVLCDNVHRDATTGKCTLLGTFSVFHPQKFPAKVRFCVYAELTDGLGETQIGLQIVESRALLDDSGEEPFAWQPPAEVSPKITFKDPLVVMQMTFMCELEL